MKFKPLGERALIKPIEREEQTASGIVLPDTAKERPQTAEVVAVGDAEESKVDVGAVVSPERALVQPRAASRSPIGVS